MNKHVTFVPGCVQQGVAGRPRRGGGVRLDAAAPARPHAGVHHDPEPLRRVRLHTAGTVNSADSN